MYRCVGLWWRHQQHGSDRTERILWGAGRISSTGISAARLSAARLSAAAAGRLSGAAARCLPRAAWRRSGRSPARSWWPDGNSGSARAPVYERRELRNRKVQRAIFEVRVPLRKLGERLRSGLRLQHRDRLLHPRPTLTRRLRVAASGRLRVARLVRCAPARWLRYGCKIQLKFAGFAAVFQEEEACVSFAHRARNVGFLFSV